MWGWCQYLNDSLSDFASYLIIRNGNRTIREVRVNIKIHQHVGKTKMRLHCNTVRVRDDDALIKDAFSVGILHFYSPHYTKSEERRTYFSLIRTLLKILSSRWWDLEDSGSRKWFRKWQRTSFNRYLLSIDQQCAFEFQKVVHGHRKSQGWRIKSVVDVVTGRNTTREGIALGWGYS